MKPLRVVIPAVVIAALSAWGSLSAVDEWRYATGTGQVVATLTQAAYGVFGVLVGWAALWRPRALAWLLQLWGISVIATGALAPVVWGEQTWIVGLWGALVVAILVALLAWWIVTVTVPSLWEEGRRRELVDRLTRLTPESRARWGRMSAPQMITHVNDQFRMALGDLPTQSKRLPIRFPPLNTLFAYVLPWPKGVPTAPELLMRLDQASQTTWSTEVATFKEVLQRFAGLPSGTAWPLHPAFGKLSRKAWGKLGYRHTDHHFRQFGA